MIHPLVLCVAVLGVGPAPPLGLQDPGLTPAREQLEGRRCAICGAELSPSGGAVVHRGRTVPLCSVACSDAFAADPDRHFESSSPRGAFLQEHPSAQEPVPRTWFWVGVVVTSAVISAATSAYVAVDRARSPRVWFALGLLGNVVTPPILLALPRGDVDAWRDGVPAGLTKLPETRRPRPCPSCEHANHPAATTCAACATALRTDVVSEVARAKEAAC